MYDFEVEKVLKWVKGSDAKFLLVQAPDGLKPYLSSLLEALEEIGITVVLSGEHSWGGCDLAFCEAEALGIKHILHVGHHGPVRFKISGFNVLFIPGYAALRLDVEPLLSQLKAMRAGRVGLAASVQHLRALEEVRRELEEEGFEVKIGGGRFPGLVIGCDYSATMVADVDVYVVIAGGVFHALGLSFMTDREVLAFDPYLGRVRTVEKLRQRVLARRLSDLSEAASAEKFFILVSVKPGQNRFALALEVKRRLEKAGRRGLIVALNEFSGEKLLNLGSCDAFVNTACPRLTTDNRDMFPRPVVNPGELRYVLEGNLAEYDLRSVLL